MLRSRPTILALLGLTVSSPALAASYVAAATGNWSSPSTWSPAAPAGGPTAGDVVTVGSGFSVTYDAGASGTVHSVLASGGTLTLARDLDVTEQARVQSSGRLVLGTRTLSGGTLTVDGATSGQVVRSTGSVLDVATLNLTRTGAHVAAPADRHDNVSISNGGFNASFTTSSVDNVSGSLSLSRGGGSTISLTLNLGADLDLAGNLFVRESIVRDNGYDVYVGGTLRNDIVSTPNLFSFGTLVRTGGVWTIGAINVGRSGVFDLRPGDVVEGEVVLQSVGTFLTCPSLVVTQDPTAVYGYDVRRGLTLEDATNALAGVTCLTSSARSTVTLNWDADLVGDPLAGGVDWALRVKGNQVSHVTSMLQAGRLVIGSVPVGETFRAADNVVYDADSGYTYVAFGASADSDGDGTRDDADLCPLDPANDVDGDFVCGDVDNCPVNTNPDQLDGDADYYGDACDLCIGDDDSADADADGVCDDTDAFPDDPDYTSDGDADGTPDQLDQCPGYDDALNTDADLFPDDCDLCPVDDENDADLDGACEIVDNCDDAPNADQADDDGDGAGDVCDADDDNDGYADVVDAFPLDAEEWADSDGDAVGDNADVCRGDDARGDTDDDATCDDLDAFPADPSEQADSDSDGFGDNADAFPLDAGEWYDTDADGYGDNTDICPTDASNADDDGDLVCDLDDACIGDNATGDTDGDQVCEDLDLCRGIDGLGDTDGDLICDGLDNCTIEPNADQGNADGDALGDVCETDGDDDGAIDDLDNCVAVVNADQADGDRDGQGDACDADDDGDGRSDATDNCPVVANASQADFDADGLGDACDGDDDADAVGDGADLCPASPLAALVNASGCSGVQLVERTCGTSATASNHGSYVSCVAQATATARAQGLLSRNEGGVIVSTAAKRK